MTNAKNTEIQKQVNQNQVDIQEIKKEMSQLNTRLTLLEYQVVAIVQDLERKAKKIVDENKISNIIPQPAKGEKEYLESLLKDKIVEPWKINLDKVREKTLDGMVDLIADSVLKVYRWNSENKKISDADHETFLKSFIDKLVDSSFAGDSSSNPKLMGIETGVKALVIAGKYMIAKSEEQKKVKELEEYWNAKKPVIESEIKKYLKDESEESLAKMLNDFCNLYKINFDRDDCKLDSFSFNDKNFFDQSFQDNYDSPFFQRSFKNIPDYIHETPVDSERSFELSQIYNSFNSTYQIKATKIISGSRLKKKDSVLSNIKLYATKEISEKDLERLNAKLNSFHCAVRDYSQERTGSARYHQEKIVFFSGIEKNNITLYPKENISEEEINKFNIKFKLKAKIKSDKKEKDINEFDLIFYLKDEISKEDFDQLIYHFKCYKDYNKNYNRLGYKFDIEIEVQDQEKIISRVEFFNQIGANKFDIKNYAKDDILEDELQKLNSQFRLCRAIKKTGEFNNSNSNAGDHYWLDKILVSSFLSIFLIGTIFGGAYASQRAYRENTWKNNISNLTENMRKCMFGFSSETLNDALKKREILSHIKIFADVTGSKYAEHFYQECLKDSYTGIEDKEVFDELYDLYSKLTNTGLANPENHYKYSFQLQQIESTEIENPALKFVLSAIERNKNKAQGLFDQVVNENPANDQSFLFGSSQVLKTALNALQNS